MAVTIRQVAKLAGVSVATVSYVLNNDPRVAPATRERVLAAVRALDYHPSSVARGLARRQTDTVGLVLPAARSVSDPFLLEFISGVGDAAQAHGLSLLLVPAPPPADPVPAAVLRRQVDGVILQESEPHDRRVEVLRRRGIPFVLFGRCLDDEGVHWIDVDNAAGSRAAVLHLAERGHRRIAYIGAPRRYMFAQFREQGYWEGLQAAGLVPDAGLVVEGDLTQEGGYAAARHLLQQDPRPTAILAANDLMAIGVLRAAREAGLRVPSDLAVVGYDGTPLSAATDPPLTTVRQPGHSIGVRALAMLVQVIRGDASEPLRELVQPTLVVRQST